MDKQKAKEHVLEQLKLKISSYNLPEKVENIPLSDEYEIVKYNDNIEDLIDPLAEFYLAKKYFVYFADRYGYIEDRANKRIFGFKAYDFQRNLIIPSIIDNRFVIFRKARQVGCSVISGLYALWKINFNIAQDVLIVSKSKMDAQDFKAKAPSITYERMPPFLKTKTTRDGQNLTTLKLVNNSRIVVRAQSPDSGRGMTPSLIILDEAAFMPYAEEIWASIFPSLSVSKGQCFIISTSNGVGNFYHQMWLKASQNENDFVPVFIPWWKFPGRDNPWLDKINSEDIEWIKKEIGEETVKQIQNNITKDLIRGEEYSILWDKLLEEFIDQEEKKNLSYDGERENKPWLKTQHDNMPTRQFYQEILARFLGSGNTVIKREAIEKMESQIREPILVDAMAKDEPVRGLNIFESPKQEINYTLISDVATGAGTDYSTMQIFRDDTLEQVAEHKAQIDTKTFGSFVKKVARYYNQAYVVIETNQGLSVFNEVFLHETDPYMNVYYELKKKAYRGFHTTELNRKLMIDELIYNLENEVLTIYSERTIEEIKVFIWHNSKAQASKGYNDDLVLPLMIFSFLMKYGNMKGKLLGFATRDQMIGMYDDEESEEAVREYELARQEIETKKRVQDTFGIEWDFYEELVK